MESSKIQGLSEEIKLFPYLDKFPKLGKNVYLASGAKIVGEVEIGNDTSIWYNTVIRGDVNFVTIGKMTNVQDSSTLRLNSPREIAFADSVSGFSPMSSWIFASRSAVNRLFAEMLAAEASVNYLTGYNI